MNRSDDLERAGASLSDHGYVLLVWRVFLHHFWYARRHADREHRGTWRRLMRAARLEFWG